MKLRALTAVATVILVLTPIISAPTPPTPSALEHAPPKRVQMAYAKLPVIFEANRGQTDPQVKFLARGPGYILFLTPTEAVLMLRSTAPIRDDRLATSIAGAVLRIMFVGANPHPQLSGFDELPGKVNYFIGNDPRKWRTNIPTYARVQHRSVYPGVDVVYYGHQRELEYDLVVAPGASPAVITLEIQGADKLHVNASGDLTLHVAGRQVRLHKPVVYQEVDGARQAVSGGYALKGRSSIKFDIGTYNASRPLIIDPVLTYSTFLGGNQEDVGNAIALDASGSTYVTGYTGSADFPTTAGAFDTVSGGFDVFITKVNPTGSALIFSTYLGGATNSDVAYGIALDASGNVYVTGVTNHFNFDFPITPGAFDTLGNGPSDVFVTKLNPTGSALVYSTYLGGILGEVGRALAVDASGSVYVTGRTTSINFPTTAGTFDMTCELPEQAFVTKVNPAGSGLIYSACLGAGEGRGIVVDGSGSAYITGVTGSSTFPTTPGAFDTTYNGLVDAFISKVNPTGSALVYSTYLGGSGRDNQVGPATGYNGIAVDESGNVYVTGRTESTDFPVSAGAFDTTANGNGDAFVTKLNGAGSALIYSTYLGGAFHEEGNAVAVDSAGNAYVTGRTDSTDFPTVSALQAVFGGEADAYVTKLNPAGSALIYSTYLGGSSADTGYGIVVDAARTAYLTGYAGPGFPVTAGSFDTTWNGGTDAFILAIATPSFSDVPHSDWGYRWIEQIFIRGITAGCATNPLRYCPDNSASRREMAVFIVRSMGQTQVSPCTGVFADVPTTDWGCGWIERIAQLGITAGCGTNPARYCPDDPVTRAQMAVFLNRASNQTACDTCGPSFADVPSSHWAFGWIERLFQRGITAGCATNPLRYCPDNNVTRREMAVFLIRNFFP